MKPFIGVVPLYDIEKESLWMAPGYMEGIVQAGGIPVILPLVTEKELIKNLADKFDGFLFTGGQDVDPALYGEEVLDSCKEICKERDEMEKILLDHVMKKTNRCWASAAAYSL